MELLFLGMLNTPEIILILVLALILFGAKKLPELAKGLGHGIKEFRKASREISDELNSAMVEEPPRRSSSVSYNSGSQEPGVTSTPGPEGTEARDASGEGEPVTEKASGGSGGGAGTPPG